MLRQCALFCKGINILQKTTLFVINFAQKVIHILRKSDVIEIIELLSLFLLIIVVISE